MRALTDLFDTIVTPDLLIRRLTISAHHLMTEEQRAAGAEQMNLFSPEETAEWMTPPAEAAAQKKEKALQEAIIAIKKAYGKNAILRGSNLIDGATARLRNAQIGGHKA
jgi:DNA polymerase V subunit umuC